MSCKYREDGHLNDHTLARLSRGAAGAAEKLEALTHIGWCDECAGRFAEMFEQDDYLTLPLQFDEGVRRKIAQIRVTATPLTLARQETKPRSPGNPGERDKKREYRRYSCKVAIAACVALLLLFSGTFSTSLNAISSSRVLNPDLSRINQLTQNLSEFSRELINWEVKDND